MTDEEGELSLPHLRRGKLEIRATAEGYAQMAEPLVASLLDEETSQLFEIFLEPELLPLRPRPGSGSRR